MSSYSTHRKARLRAWKCRRGIHRRGAGTPHAPRCKDCGRRLFVLGWQIGRY